MPIVDLQEWEARQVVRHVHHDLPPGGVWDVEVQGDRGSDELLKEEDEGDSVWAAT